jgi:betaine reductase
MDLDTQAQVMRIAGERAGEDLVVILGSPNPESAGLYAETVTVGDPPYAGPLAGVPLGLPVYHILETEVKDQIATEIYEREVGMMETVLEAAAISEQVSAFRRRPQDS